jgi:predicted transcriptional regulator
VILPDGQVETSRLSKRLKVTKTELALAAGLSRPAVSKTARLASQATQGRLRDMVEIVNRVLRTAEDLVKEGRAEAVKAYLSRIAVGGYA